MSTTVMLRKGFAFVAAAIVLGAAPAAADEPALASDWVTDHSSRVRLIAGGVPAAGGKRLTMAGVEILMDEGWKTYWRNPGSAGVPPRIDWSGSENLAKAVLLFPAPERFKDRDGDTIGYKKSVILPIAVTPKDPSRPVDLKLAMEYGVCKEICIPVQPELSLSLPPDIASRSGGTSLQTSVSRIPQPAAARRPQDPGLRKVEIELAGPKPRIVIEAAFFGDGRGADAFLEAPEGLWIPLPQPSEGEAGPIRRFLVDLTDGADLNDLRGKTIRLTLVSAAGQSEADFKLE